MHRTNIPAALIICLLFVTDISSLLEEMSIRAGIAAYVPTRIGYGAHIGGYIAGGVSAGFLILLGIVQAAWKSENRQPMRSLRYAARR